jgi:hypothetical protein
MLRVVIFLWLCIAVAKGYIISPRDEPQLTDETKAALKDAGIDISELHVRPKQVHHEQLLL